LVRPLSRKTYNKEEEESLSCYYLHYYYDYYDYDYDYDDYYYYFMKHILSTLEKVNSNHKIL